MSGKFIAFTIKEIIVISILTLYYSLLFGQGPITGVDHSIFATSSTLIDFGYGIPTAYPENHNTFRVYAYLDDANSILHSICTFPNGLDIYIGTDTPDGYVWNYPFGVIQGDAIPTGLINLMNDNGTILYDSFVTIGSENDISPIGATSVFFAASDSNVPHTTYWGTQNYSNESSPDFIMSHGAWILGDLTGTNAYGVGPSFRVLIAQITTTAADIHYGLNITSYSDIPVSAGEAWITYWNPSGIGETGLSEVDGSNLGLRYPIPTGCAGDANSDGSVNILDLMILSSSFGCTACFADVDGDNDVDILDLLFLSNNFNIPCE